MPVADFKFVTGFFFCNGMKHKLINIYTFFNLFNMQNKAIITKKFVV